MLDAYFAVKSAHSVAAVPEQTGFELPSTVADFAFPEGVSPCGHSSSACRRAHPCMGACECLRVLVGGVRVCVRPPEPSFHAFVLTDVGGTRYFGYCCRKSYRLPREQLAVFKQVCGAQIFTSMYVLAPGVCDASGWRKEVLDAQDTADGDRRVRRAYSEMEELPSEFFSEQALIIITALPLHRHWEHFLISFCNSLPTDLVFDGMRCCASHCNRGCVVHRARAARVRVLRFMVTVYACACVCE